MLVQTSTSVHSIFFVWYYKSTNLDFLPVLSARLVRLERYLLYLRNQIIVWIVRGVTVESFETINAVGSFATVVSVVSFHTCVTAVSVVSFHTCVTAVSVVSFHTCVTIVSLVSFHTCVTAVSVVSFHRCVTIDSVIRFVTVASFDNIKTRLAKLARCILYLKNQNNKYEQGKKKNNNNNNKVFRFIFPSDMATYSPKSCRFSLRISPMIPTRP
jgi:hypothetical protein